MSRMRIASFIVLLWCLALAVGVACVCPCPPPPPPPPTSSCAVIEECDLDPQAPQPLCATGRAYRGCVEQLPDPGCYLLGAFTCGPAGPERLWCCPNVAAA